MAVCLDPECSESEPGDDAVGGSTADDFSRSGETSETSDGCELFDVKESLIFSGDFFHTLAICLPSHLSGVFVLWLSHFPGYFVEVGSSCFYVGVLWS